MHVNTPKHQVFVSSTFLDLVEERQEVMHALLELDCIPAGMEFFPAANNTAWELIQKRILDSDYYIIIVGGKYGSMDATGISFTEKEYDFAQQNGLPIIPLLHENPDAIVMGKSEAGHTTRIKLQEFREKIQKHHHCKYWLNSEDLAAKATRGIVNARNEHPRSGWKKHGESIESSASPRSQSHAFNILGRSSVKVNLINEEHVFLLDDIFVALAISIHYQSSKVDASELAAEILRRTHPQVKHIPTNSFSDVYEWFIEAGLLIKIDERDLRKLNIPKNPKHEQQIHGYFALTAHGKHKAKGILQDII